MSTMGDSIPPSWEDLASNRERLARIETKVDMVLSTLVVQDQKISTLDARQTGLEAGRLANRADIAALQEQVKEWKVERAEADLSVPQFLAWKGRVDSVIDQVNKGAIVLASSTKTRKQDVAVLGGGITMALSILGLAAKVFL